MSSTVFASGAKVPRKCRGLAMRGPGSLSQIKCPSVTDQMSTYTGVAQADPGVGTPVSRAYGFGHALYGQWPGTEAESTDGTQAQKGHL